MFFTTSGTTFEIGTARPDWMARQVSGLDFAGEVWTPVVGVNSLGRIAGEWGVEEINLPNPYQPDDPQMPTTVKSVRPAPAMQLIVGVIDSDSGQSRLVEAESSVASFAFRMILPNGQLRRFIALVTAADHIFDEANAVVCWAFSLKLQSNIYRGE